MKGNSVSAGLVLTNGKIYTVNEAQPWAEAIAIDNNEIIFVGSLDVGYVILATAALSFLGLGAQPPTPEWGAMINEARQFMHEAWWYTTFQSLAIFLAVLSFNLIGDALRDYLDPKMRGH